MGIVVSRWYERTYVDWVQRFDVTPYVVTTYDDNLR